MQHFVLTTRQIASFCIACSPIPRQMRGPNRPAPRRGPPPPRRRQHSQKCRTPRTPRASERAAGALPFAAPQGRRQGSQRLRTGPSGPARGRRRSDPRRSAASSRRQRKAHFLRMAFIGASSGAAAFFFLMARRFMPFMAFAFLPPTNLSQDPLR